MPKRWNFTVVPGFLADYTDPANQNPNGKAITQPGLGLLPRSYPTDTDTPADAGGHGEPQQKSLSVNGKDNEHAVASSNPERSWPRFMGYLTHLNHEAPEGTKYKVVFLTRHGVGWHNKKEGEVGTEAWDVSHTYHYRSFKLALCNRGK
jgi:hypothetical protein